MSDQTPVYRPSEPATPIAQGADPAESVLLTPQARDAIAIDILDELRAINAELRAIRTALASPLSPQRQRIT